MRGESEARRTAAEYVATVVRLLGDIDADRLVRVAGYLQRARDGGSTIYVAGNGGSAATASHWANDLGKATRRPGAAPVRVVSLCDQTSWLTALANDEGYQRVFAGQLESLARPGDVLAVFSASGNSANLLEAVATARRFGVLTLALLGFDGGALRPLVDDYILVPTPKGAYGPVEDAHLVLCHALTICLASGCLAVNDEPRDVGAMPLSQVELLHTERF
jgi:D-sedoheptulose 7-phosphate isomerase